MKILWLSHIVPYPPKAGVLQRCYNMLNELAKYHSVDLLTFTQKGILEQIYKNPDEGLKIARAELGKICSNMEFIPIESEKTRFGQYILAFKSLFTAYPYTINWLESIAYLDTLRLWIKQNDYDLIYFDTISLAPYLNEIGDLPSIMDHHNIESHLLLRRAGQEKNPVKRYYYRQEGKRLEDFERTFCRKFDMNITCSDMDSERLLEIDSGISAEVVPNAVSIKPEVEIEADTQQRIVFIGTLNWEPNTKAVIYLANKIWPQLKTYFPDAKCDVIGAFPPKVLTQLAKNDPSFNVHGFVPDLDEYQRPGTIFVCPIKDGGGTKLKVLDALGTQAAVVADPIACEGIDVTHGKDVLLASIPKEYVEQIAKLFHDAELRQKLGANARELIKKKYTYESVGLAFSELCEEIVAKHSSKTQ